MMNGVTKKYPGFIFFILFEMFILPLFIQVRMSQCFILYTDSFPVSSNIS
jgi:hypothetical protein